MAVRLGEYVVYGELRNKRRYSTFGFVVLRSETPGDETCLHFELTGDCDPDLRGKTIRFRPDDDSAPQIFPAEDFRNVQMRQIGPTGTMTADGWARTFEGSVEEFYTRSKLGEQPPTEWKRRLYLEWYGQNGRALIEMAGVIVEECTRQPKGEDEGDWRPLPNGEPKPDDYVHKESRGLEITSVERTDDGFRVETWTEADFVDDAESGQVPDGLQRQLDREAAAIDRAIRDPNQFDDDDEEMREIKLIDDCIEFGQQRPLNELIFHVDNLPDPDTLDDAAVESQLKLLLAQLAIIGVALDVCEHFTPRDCYRYLLDRLPEKDGNYPELIGTGWVTHMCTWEDCPKCEAETDERLDRELGPRE